MREIFVWKKGKKLCIAREGKIHTVWKGKKINIQKKEIIRSKEKENKNSKSA